MGHARRPFDIKPTVFIVIFSLLLAGMLIALNSRSVSEPVETAARASKKEGAERVVARQVGSQSAGRQVVSPQIAADANALSAGIGLAGAAVPLESSNNATELLANEANDVAVDVEVASETIELAVAPSPPTTTATVSIVAPDAATTTTAATPANRVAPVSPTTAAPRTRVTTAPTTETTTAPRVTTTTTTRAPATTTTRAPVVVAAPVTTGRYSVAQVIDGTIGAGDGSNPNEESPMGRHDAPLYLPQSWNWAQGPTRNGLWGQLSAGQFAEFRCAVIPENGHVPPVPFRINFRSGAYYQFANGAWDKAFDVALTSTANGAYLGQAGQVNADPFGSGGHGRIEWRQEADGSFSAPWNANALMMHFWAGKRQAPASGQTAEFLESEMRLQQPDGQQVDLSQVDVLFQCGLDYYNSTGGQGTQVPGPGIAKYHRLTTSWNPGLWVTLPGNAPAASPADFRTWLEANLPPDVRN